jgi:uncharacterized protein
LAAAFGVGVVFNSVLPVFLEANPGVIDYIELIPETLWTDNGRGLENRFTEVKPAIEQLERLAEHLPVACHGVGMSIGSAMPLDQVHLKQVRSVLDRFEVERFSEHLGFSRIANGDSADRHMGVGLPLPCDEDVLGWLTGRVREVQAALGTQVIFENGVRHTPFVDEDMSEAEFMNRLAADTGCGMLLDLHNLYVDCRNNGWEAEAYLDKLDLGIVREIHMAGGSVIGGAYTDSHAGPSPAEVWNILHIIGPNCVNLEGITFEFHDSYYPGFGERALLSELANLRAFWREGRRVS